MIFLCEFEVHDGTSINKLYVGTHGIRSGPTDTPANQYYEPRLSSVGRIERSMFGSGDGVSGGTTGGSSEVGFGNISVLNGSPYGDTDLIDHWKDFAFRSVTIKSLTGESQSYAQAEIRFIGAIENIVSTNALEQYDLVLHDRLQDFEKPLLTHVYLGTTTSGGTGTVEGDVDLKDQIKQKIWGTVHNVTAISVNPFDLVYQISDGQVASITVYDGGVSLTNAGNAGSLPALFSTAVAAGSYLTCTSLGLFILGSPAIGSVTADVVEGATAAARTAAQIVSRMVAWFQSMYPQLSVAITSSDVTALDALNSAECGILVTDTENALEAITRVLNSIGAWMLPRSNSTSMFDLGRMDLPSGTAVASYDFEDNLSGNPQRIESGDESKGVPAWKIIVRYDQIATVQTGDNLFGLVTENDPIRVQYLATEWRQASVENSAILSIWPNAPTLTTDTRLVSQSAAQAEAARLFAMHGVQRDIWRITVPMSDDPDDDPGIGEVVELTSRRGRMGLGRELGSGDVFRVLGRVDDYDAVPKLELTLYGSPALHFVAALARIAESALPRETVQFAGARFFGAGTLTANPVVSTGPVKIGAAQFAGAGNLSINLRSRLVAAARFAGAGNLSANPVVSSGPIKLAAARFDGAGSLSANVRSRLVAAARFAGAGNLSADAVVPVVGLDSATSAWISAVVGAGGSVSGSASSGRQALDNALITGLKSDGVWSKLDVLWIKAAENTQSGLIDLKSLIQGTVVGGVTFTPDRGFTCFGGGAYLNLPFIPTTHGVNYTLNSAHIGVWNLDDGGSTGAQIYFNTGQTSLYPRYTDDNAYLRVNVNSGGAYAATDARGFTVANRKDASTIQGYKNGVSMGADQFVGANALDSDVLIAFNRTTAAISIGGHLTPTEHLALYNRLRTYMTAVGVP